MMVLFGGKMTFLEENDICAADDQPVTRTLAFGKQ